MQDDAGTIPACLYMITVSVAYSPTAASSAQCVLHTIHHRAGGPAAGHC